METLMAPWRYSYITAKKPEHDGCIFCDFPKDQDDEKHFILHRGQNCYAMLNLYPYASGHLMILPYRHISDLSEMTDQEALEFHQMTVQAIAAVRGAMNPQGFNVGINMGSAAGAGMAAHLHRHLVPRWSGDSNFMQVLAGTSVMPISLQECWKLFRDHWR